MSFSPFNLFQQSERRLFSLEKETIKKRHERELAAVHKDHKYQIYDLNRAHSKTIKSLQDEVKMLTALAEKRKQELEDFKVSRNKAMSIVLKQHAAVIIQKNAEIKTRTEEVCAYHDMMHEMSAEVYSANKEARDHKRKSIQSQDTATKRLQREQALRNTTAELREKLDAEKDLRKDLDDTISVMYSSLAANEDIILRQRELIEKLKTRLIQMRPRTIEMIPRAQGGLTWPTFFIEMSLELLANRVPPSCMHHAIIVVASALFPQQKLVKKLPTTRFFCNLRTVLLVVTKSFAAYQVV